MTLLQRRLLRAGPVRCHRCGIRLDYWGWRRAGGRHWFCPHCAGGDPMSKRRVSRDCAYCQKPVIIAVCFDQQWRPFDVADIDDDQWPEDCRWAWHGPDGMVRQDLVPFRFVRWNLMHHCPEYAKAKADAEIDRMRVGP